MLNIDPSNMEYLCINTTLPTSFLSRAAVHLGEATLVTVAHPGRGTSPEVATPGAQRVSRISGLESDRTQLLKVSRNHAMA